MKKATHTTQRDLITSFQALVNVGPAIERDFQALGLRGPQDLIGKDPWVLYCELCQVTNVRQDPCVLDVMMAAVDYMNGAPPQPWWSYTVHRKSKYSDALEQFSKSISTSSDR